MKYIITENQKRSVEFKYLDYLFDGIYEVKPEEYSDSIFWKKDDEVVLELNESGDLWLSHSTWDTISDLFLLNYNETQQLIKKWMEQNLGLKECVPSKLNYYMMWRWDEI